MTDAPADIRRCRDCACELAPNLLVCPVCHALVHAEELKAISADARRFADAGDLVAALSLWRRALDLLPPNTAQVAAITNITAELTRRIDAGESRHSTSAPLAAASGREVQKKGLWATALAIGAIVLTKGKLLIGGLTKIGTVLTMLTAFGVYWTMWGWKFAAGLVIGIYIHEMGHVVALRRYGMAASAPMFIPGFGALIRLRVRLTNPIEDARVGLAGPIWGLAATLAAYGGYLATGEKMLAAIAHINAWINLFNLVPFGSLDGGRGFNAISRVQRLLLVGVMIGMWQVTGEGVLLLIAILAGIRALSNERTTVADWTATVQFAVLLIALGALCHTPAALVDDLNKSGELKGEVRNNDHGPEWGEAKCFAAIRVFD